MIQKPKNPAAKALGALGGRVKSERKRAALAVSVLAAQAARKKNAAQRRVDKELANNREGDSK